MRFNTINRAHSLNISNIIKLKIEIKSIVLLILIMKVNELFLESFGNICRNELCRMFDSISKKYGEKYGFTANDLIDEYLPQEYVDLEIIGNQDIRKKKLEKQKLDPKRCIARTWSEGKGKQCKRNSVKDNEYCGIHLNEIKRKGCLIRGTIYGENLSRKFLSENLEKKKKRQLKKEKKKKELKNKKKINNDLKELEEMLNNYYT